MINFKNSYKKYVFRLEQINQAAAICPEQFVYDIEEGFKSEIIDAAKFIVSSKNHKVVMIAGPSSSGKTTTAHMIKNELTKMGFESVIISLDDFFLGKDRVPFDENGHRNYDSIDSVDIEKIKKCIKEIINEGESRIPIYDFTKMQSKKETREIKVSKDSVVIIEGIHALNPVLIPNIDPESIVKIYADVKQGIKDYNRKVLSARDVRFVRRVVRDFKYRAMPVERTVEMWESVCKNEDIYIKPYKRMCDFTINSFHIYEPCIFAKIALPFLDNVSVESRHYKYVRHIFLNLKRFYPIDVKIIPEDSLMMEFI